MRKGSKATNIMELVSLLRSKNAGPLLLGFDMMFKDQKGYQLAKRHITKKLVAELYNIPEEDVVELVHYDPGMGTKVTIRRPSVSGDHADTDVYGTQQHVPLQSIEFPLDG